jgi:hypothetical protein
MKFLPEPEEIIAVGNKLGLDFDPKRREHGARRL